MGLTRQKRNRMEAPRNLPVEVLSSLGETNIKYEKYDISNNLEKVNKRLDVQEAKLKKR